MLAHLRCGDTYTGLATGFGVGVTTVWRYVSELVDLLAQHAPDLAAAMDAARRKAYAVLDGTLISIDRVECAPARTGRTTPASTSGTG